MLVSFAHAVILYLALILVIRLMGKRQLGQMEPTEFVVTMLIADLASVPMQDEGIPLLSGLIPILVVLAIELLLSVLVYYSVRADGISAPSGRDRSHDRPIRHSGNERLHQHPAISKASARHRKGRWHPCGRASASRHAHQRRQAAA